MKSREKVELEVVERFHHLAWDEEVDDHIALRPKAEVISQMEKEGWEVNWMVGEDDGKMVVEFKEVEKGFRFFAVFEGYDAEWVTLLHEGYSWEMD